jgi:class 3 adenylate cyclase
VTSIGKTYLYLKNRFASLRIRVKLVIIIGMIFVGLTFILSFIILQNGKSVLNERLTQTCNMSLRHIAQVIKDDLLFYYSSRSDPEMHSTHIGAIREAALGLMSEKIDGLIYVGVIDRNGMVIAHSNLSRINHTVIPQDSALFVNLKTTFKREKNDNIEYLYPLFALKDTGETVFLGVVMIGFSKTIIMRPIRETSRMILVVTVGITVIAIIFISFVAQRMTRQIDALANGVRKISNGELEFIIPILSEDELGQLAKEFNNMTVHLAEKIQMQKFVSKLTVQMIRKGSQGKSTSLTGERRMVSILFSDVRSFSFLTERLGAEEIVRLINIYLDMQAKIIEEHNGIVDKFMGDQVMAIFFGDDQADQAVRTAIEIQRSIQELNKRRNRTGEIILTVGIGLHSGPAVTGHMGSASRMDYTVIGEVVNLASRLCSIAKPGQIIAATDMINQLNEDFNVIHLDSVTIKGRSTPVQVCEIDYNQIIVSETRKSPTS